MKRLLAIAPALFAVALLLGVLVPESASANATWYCSKTATGTVAVYTFPDTCSITNFPSGYHTMYVNIFGQCTSTQVRDSWITAQFNSDINVYDSRQGSYLTSHDPPNAPGGTIGKLPCLQQDNHFAGAISLKVLMGLNQSDYSIQYLSRNTWPFRNSFNNENEVESLSGFWWNFEPDGPPLTHISFIVTNGGNFSQGTRFSVYFE